MKRSRAALLMFLATLAAACQMVGSASAQRGNFAGHEPAPQKFQCPWAPEDYRTATTGDCSPYEDDEWYGDSCHSARPPASKPPVNGCEYHGADCYDGHCGDYYKYAGPVEKTAREINEYQYNFQAQPNTECDDYDDYDYGFNDEGYTPSPATDRANLDTANALNLENEGLQAAAYGFATQAHDLPPAEIPNDLPPAEVPNDLPPAETLRDIVPPGRSSVYEYDGRSSDWRNEGYGYEEDEYGYDGQYGATDLHPDNLPPAEVLKPLAPATPSQAAPVEDYNSPCHRSYNDQFKSCPNYDNNYDYNYEDEYEFGYRPSRQAEPGNDAANASPVDECDAGAPVLGDLLRSALRSTSRMLEGLGQSLLGLSETIGELAGDADELEESAELSQEMPRPWPATLGCPPRNTQHLGL